MITPFELSVLEHTSRTGRYVTGEAGVFEMAKRGLLNDHGGTGFWPAGTRGFTMSHAGREALREHCANLCRFPMPKPKRPASEAFIRWRAYCDGCQRISFSTFCKDVWPHRALFVLLLFCSCAQAKPTQPANLRYGPFIEQVYFPSGKLRETHTLRLTVDGQSWSHTITNPSGKSDTRVFPVVPFRINPSSK